MEARKATARANAAADSLREWKTRKARAKAEAIVGGMNGEAGWRR
jgi:hypothetical protein